MRIVGGYGITFGGLDLQGMDEFGVSWKTNALEDWDAPPGNTTDVVQNSFSDGGWMSPGYREPKTVRIVGRLVAPDRPAARAAIYRLTRVIPSVGTAVVAVSEDGTVTHRQMKIDGAPKIPRPTDVYASFDLLLTAPASRLFSGDGSSPYQFSASVFLPFTSGGLQLSVTAPFSIGATVVNGSVTVTAAGDAPPPVLVRVNGPAVQPVIRDGDGDSMLLDISLDAGQWLDVDLDARTIKINSTVNRRNVLRGPWIVPRAGMVLSLDAAVYDPLTSMTVFWTDASY
ncbi:hypothetical protein [Arthrobacter alpinus]|nr:hypothetical protein [Arthrobacter alpinus]